ncbi:MAG TPA: hypothetical protein VNX27_02270 [Chthoniobacterales bacterium]|jgi:hypothetical protein|nr:hypothetical protein [Chthoniobacterales bacterium]
MRLLVVQCLAIFATSTVILCVNPRSQAQNDQASDVTVSGPVIVRGTAPREFDLAKSQARARIAYTSSGPRILSGRMIDSDLQTVFQFSESDASPTVIVELAKSAQLHRVSAAFKAEDARFEVFLLNELPKDPTDLRFATPSGSVVELPDEKGMVAVNFSVSSARYVALRWKRNKRQDPLIVAEISAFSNDPTDTIYDQDPHLADNGSAMTSFQPPSVPVVSP